LQTFALQQMNLLLQLSRINSDQSIRISGSKSETNRLLLLQALYPEIILENTSNSDDSEVMLKALSGNESTIDIHHAGTAMRFLTAFFAIQEGREIILTGSPRMKERPISILVDALRQLGAHIEYAANEGFPPLRIFGKRLIRNKISIHANVSSQYISALLLIAPALENGLELTLEGAITSMPYINMTLGLLSSAGIETSFIGNKITVGHKGMMLHPKQIVVESDWSSASYFYSIIALSDIGTRIDLSSYNADSFQGDSALAKIYESFGVETIFNGNSITLKKNESLFTDVSFELNDTPDIAQTMAVTCFGLGIGCHLTGLHTLKIKETDRVSALETELAKLGAKVSITNDSLTLEATHAIIPNIKIATYHDHRMAMAFAPLALRVPIEIEDAGVVSKSYPSFWNDLKNIGFEMT
jgi:3-phosphoshikimate 1-carboxyvinyltransferase